MDEQFTLTIGYNGKNYELQSRLALIGYTHKFLVTIEGVEIAFEPDEERNYRAIVDQNILQNRNIDKGLLEAISNTIREIRES